MSDKKLVDPYRQSKGFERVREAHQSETAEDYVELIMDLIAAKREARITDLSQRLGVSHATVNKVIARLKKEKLVVSEPYRSIYLTEKGKALAEACKKRHEIVVRFLKALGVSDEIAELDAEGMEHHISEETLQAFKDFAEK